MDNGRMGGNTRQDAFKKQHKKKECKLYEGDLIQGKHLWTQKQDYYWRPYGCPEGHNGPEERPVPYKQRNKRKLQSPPATTHLNESREENQLAVKSLRYLEPFRTIEAPLIFLNILGRFLVYSL